MSEIVLAVLLGFAAGGMSGLFGVGGGILFVPTLVLVLDLTQLSAQATSLAAMIPVVAVGAWRQHRYGNVRWRAALVVGLASAVGVAGGVVLADSLGDVTLRRLFAALLVVVAAQLAWSARRA
ncbi:MAG: sulfite exporter TauE/SafE family protein [Gaiellaceae bacterium]